MDSFTGIFQGFFRDLKNNCFSEHLLKAVSSRGVSLNKSFFLSSYIAAGNIDQIEVGQKGRKANV